MSDCIDCELYHGPRRRGTKCGACAALEEVPKLRERLTDMQKASTEQAHRDNDLLADYQQRLSEAHAKLVTATETLELIGKSRLKGGEDHAAAMYAREAIDKLNGRTRLCEKGGDHEWGIDGMHQNEFCKKCFQNKRPEHTTDTSPLDAYKALEISARLWMEYVERNGGCYLPEHAQWIKTALNDLDKTKAEKPSDSQVLAEDQELDRIEGAWSDWIESRGVRKDPSSCTSFVAGAKWAAKVKSEKPSDTPQLTGHPVVTHDRCQTLYGKAFQVARSLMPKDAYEMFVSEMDQARADAEKGNDNG